MDTLREINELIRSLSPELQSRINAGVSQHISRAEYHFSQARIRRDDQYFTDAIYRTNQAYEGILREAYEILAKKTSENVKTYLMEKFFEENNIFNERVKNVFMNYRQQWRNPSTHNHNLFFKNDESFLAIVNVSAFIYILLNQIVERVSYTSAKEAFKASKPVIGQESQSEQGTLNRLIQAFLTFSKNSTVGSSVFVSEAQLLGQLIAYLEEVIPEVEIQNEVQIKDIKYYLDLVLTSQGLEPIIVEVKSRFDKKHQNDVVLQVSAYLEATGYKVAFVYFFPDRKEVEYRLETERLGSKTIYLFVPLGKGLTKIST